MNDDSSNSFPDRRRPVHHPVVEPDNRSVIVFLTVCTADRRPILATPEMHALLRESWLQATHWRVGRYVIMPDHLHLFCGPATNPPESLRLWVAFWKRLAALAAGGRFWQKNFWDTQLRRHESYAAKWNYVRNNPVRAGLVAQPEDWSYQGELNVLRWHD
jgi:putative transposase